ncbi:preprotein translocase subunit SecE [Erythrobacter sp.]|uniref:preprotein translocase subunit SecE n=1 Tax=Erythrobacter sp. TaxID=1042 RepID=UPI001425EE86|nr:preprotein translocase subunit SecE [Erythrobacter sp.]QIQ87053.1 MAG: preprotein translocase subunit SecE [Erythrobacter sp.]
MAEQKTEPKKRKTSVAEFVNQVRTETSKVVWPTREETIRTAIFVFIMTLILSLFFLGIDSAFNAVVNFLLTLA